MTDKITIGVAANALRRIDAGLPNGLGTYGAGNMCVMAAVSMALGEGLKDTPSCVSDQFRGMMISINDTLWSNSRAYRAKGLRRLAIAVMGTAGVWDWESFPTFKSKAMRRLCDIFAAHGLALTMSEWNSDISNFFTTLDQIDLPAPEKQAIREEMTEAMVQILIEMKSPGTEYLCLTEAPEAA